MKQISRKQFAIIFSILLSLQYCQSSQFQYLNDANRKNDYHEDKPDSSAIRNLSGELSTSNIKKSVTLFYVFLPAMVNIGISTALMMNCNAYAPNLAKNLRRIKAMEADINQHTARINIEWTKVTSVNRQLESLNTSLTVLKSQMDQMYTLEEDMILLLDPKIFEKIKAEEERLEQNIKENNETVVIDLDKLNVRFMTLVGAAIKGGMTFLGVLAMWGTFKLEKFAFSSYKSKIEIKKWLKSKPDVFGNKQFKAKGFLDRQVPYKKYMIKARITDQAMARKIRFQQSKMERFKKVLKHVKLVGAVVVNGIVLVTQILDTIRHITRCTKASEATTKTIETLTKTKKNITRISADIKNLEKNSTTAFKELAQVLQEAEFFTFVNDAYNIANNNKLKYHDMQLAEKKIVFFKLRIRMYDFDSDFINYKEIQSAVKSLAEGITLVNKHLRCNNNRLKIAVKAVRSCERGEKNENIVAKVNRDVVEYMKTCLFIEETKITSKKLDSMLKRSMANVNKSDVCIRNNHLVQQMVCTNWFNGLSDVDNANKIADVSIDDVIYVRKRCKGKSTDSDIGKKICIDKTYGKTLSEVIKLYNNYDKNQVTLLYQSCNLTDSQKMFICNLKNQGYNFPYVQSKLENYDQNTVLGIYSKCVQPLNGQVIAFICVKSKVYNIQDANDPRLAKQKKLYGYAKVQSILKDRCPHLFP